MNTHHITTEDFNTLLSLISYFHNKIREGSQILGEPLDLISEELISEIAEFVDLDPHSNIPATVPVPVSSYDA